ncbi:hypothetical protein [Campylobacter devanensis]|uniref:hypothetical protein n=1 Tax=Campylobacter devanensis TaxID=3161138 RepID=UPI000A346CFC|nr:hypothetical protein [Campylobacter sp. P0227]
MDLDPRDGDEPRASGAVNSGGWVIWSDVLAEFGWLFDGVIFVWLVGLFEFVKSNLFNIGVFRELRVKLSSIIGGEYGVLLEEQDIKIKDINSKDSKFLICGILEFDRLILAIILGYYKKYYY